MALFMVANDLTPEEVADPDKEIAFPESVVSLFRGELGFPPDGFPKALERKVLKGEAPLVGRAGEHIAPVDLEATRKELDALIEREASETDLASYLMYPKVFLEYAAHRREFGDVSRLPTSPFFYGMQDREEVAVAIDKGKTLIVRQVGRSEVPDEEGKVKVFFEVNGQPRTVRVAKAGLENVPKKARPRADDTNICHVGAPMPGAVVTVAVKPGQKVARGARLVSIEAMKMETMLTAERDAVVKAVHVKPGDVIAAKDLLVEFA
jgi:pyruvate carboxylase